MTTNQINYWKLEEDKRHNKASEGETARHNVVTERQKDRDIDISRASLAETARHNVVNEQLNQVQYEENARHNRQQEQASFIQANAAASQANSAARRANAEVALSGEKLMTQKHITRKESSLADEAGIKAGEAIDKARITAKELDYYEIPVIGGFISAASKIFK